MDKKHKLLIIGDHLGLAGAQRQLIYLLKNLDSKKFNISLLIFNKNGEGLNEIPNDINIYYLFYEKIDQARSSRPILTLYRLVRVFIKLIFLQKKRQYDFIYGNLFSPNILACLLKMGFYGKNKFKVIISVVNNPLKNSFIKRQLIKLFYKKADRVLACATGLPTVLKKDFNIPEENISIVFNAVDPEFVLQKSKEPINHPWFNEDIPILITVAHIQPQKGYSYLIEAFNEVLMKTDVRLIIIGNGGERRKIESLVHNFHINDNVEFFGVKENTYKYIVNSTIFILSSLWEGLATVLLEAAILNTPIVATDAPFGTSDVIINEQTGLLVPIKNSSLLADKINTLLCDKKLRKNFADKARCHVQNNYTDTIVTKAFEDVIISIQ